MSGDDSPTEFAGYPIRDFLPEPDDNRDPRQNPANDPVDAGVSAHAIERLREALDRLRDTEGVEDEWDAALTAVEALLADMKRIAGDDPNGFEGFHFVGDESNPDECPGCIARAAVRRVETGQ